MMKSAVVWTIAAFFVAPLAIAVVMAFWGVPAKEYDLISALSLIPVFYFFAALPLIIFGVPAYFVLNHLHRINLLTLLMSGCLIGAISALALRLPGIPEANDFKVCMMLGFLGSFFFWVCWRRGRS